MSIPTHTKQRGTYTYLIEDDRIYKSQDQGVNWFISKPDVSAEVIKAAPGNPRTAWYGDFDLNPNIYGAYQTTDGGFTWTRRIDGLSDPLVTALAIDPSDPDHVICGCNSIGNLPILYRWNPVREEWVDITYNLTPPYNCYVSDLAIHDDGINPPVYFAAMVVNSTQPIYYGVYRFNTSTNTWTQLSATLTLVSNFELVPIAFVEPVMLVANHSGYQVVERYNINSGTWEANPVWQNPGNYGPVFVDYANGRVNIIANGTGFVYYNGGGFSTSMFGLQSYDLWDLEFDAEDNDIAYTTSGQCFYRSTDEGYSWDQSMQGMEHAPLGLVSAFGSDVITANEQTLQGGHAEMYSSEQSGAGISFGLAVPTGGLEAMKIYDLEFQGSQAGHDNKFWVLGHHDYQLDNPQDRVWSLEIGVTPNPGALPAFATTAQLHDLDVHPYPNSENWVFLGGGQNTGPWPPVDCRFVISNNYLATVSYKQIIHVSTTHVVAADPSVAPDENTGTYYAAGTASGSTNWRICQSINGGNSWTRIDQDLFTTNPIKDIIVNNTGQLVYTATSTGVYRYEVSTGTWSLYSNGINPNYLNVLDLEFGVRNTEIVSVGANAAGLTKIFATGNGGLRWVDMTRELPANEPVKNIRRSGDFYYVGCPSGLYRFQAQFAGEDVVTDITWTGEVWLMDDITVSSTLTLDNSGDSLRIYAMGDYTITVDSGNIITTNASAEHKVEFSAGEGVDGWGGITIKQFSDTLNHTLQYLQVENADYGVKIIPDEGAQVRATLSHCRFQNDSTGIGARDAKDLAITYCTISDNVLDGLYLFNLASGGSHSVSNCEICDNGQAGIYVNRCGPDLDITQNYIHGNDGGDDGFIYQGITNYNSSPCIFGNHIEESGTAALGAFNSAAPSLVDGVNTLETSDSVAAVIYTNGGFPILNNAYNNILNNHASNYLLIVDDTNPRVYRRVENNWWGSTNPDCTWFFPLGYFDYNPWCGQEQTLQSFQYGTSSFEDSCAYLLLTQALEAENLGNYSVAYNLLLDLVDNFPGVEDAVCQALPHILSSGAGSGQSYEALAGYFGALYQINPVSLAGKTARHLRNDCWVAIEDYQEAINDYQTIISDPPTLADSVFAVLDQAQIYLIMSGQGMPGTFSVNATTNLESYRQKEASLMSLLGGGQIHNITTTDTEALPTSFGLSQNFPNPFNSSTSLRYALPQAANVTMRVYDTVGRVVATLVNGFRQAGTHSATFEGLRFSSGIYFVRMQAGRFVAMEKMVLLK